MVGTTGCKLKRGPICREGEALNLQRPRAQPHTGDKEVSLAGRQCDSFLERAFLPGSIR